MLVLSTGIAFGQQNGKGKTQQRTDSATRVTTIPPKRVTYLKEKGIFLTDSQEILTLEKLQWKELYRQDAVTMYWVNEALQERVDDQALKIKRLEEDLKRAESEIKHTVDLVEYYRKVYEYSESKNAQLVEDKAKLKKKLFIYRGVSVVLGTGLIYLAVKPLLP
jgi:protein associated with RNAse G/E